MSELDYALGEVKGTRDDSLARWGTVAERSPGDLGDEIMSCCSCCCFAGGFSPLQTSMPLFRASSSRGKTKRPAG